MSNITRRQWCAGVGSIPVLGVCPEGLLEKETVEPKSDFRRLAEAAIKQAGPLSDEEEYEYSIIRASDIPYIQETSFGTYTDADSLELDISKTESLWEWITLTMSNYKFQSEKGWLVSNSRALAKKRLCLATGEIVDVRPHFNQQ